MTENTIIEQSRFKGLPWVERALKTTVHVIGAGGIGSWLSLFLVRAGFKVRIYDDDLVEYHNIGGQFYSSAQEGVYKTDALVTNIRHFSGNYKNGYDLYLNCLINTIRVNRNFLRDSLTNYDEDANIICLAVDNMSTRKELSELFFQSPNSDLLIDSRLLAEQFQIFCLDKTSKDFETTSRMYKKNYLFDDSEVPDADCTMKQTTHISAMLGGVITSYCTNFIGNQVFSDKVFSIPALTFFFGPLGTYTIQDKL